MNLRRRAYLVVVLVRQICREEKLISYLNPLIAGSIISLAPFVFNGHTDIENRGLLVDDGTKKFVPITTRTTFRFQLH